jgi:DNA-binding MarR family transcriptional regulator
MSDALTPDGGLPEGGLHGVVGYRLAQAAVATQAVYDRLIAAPFDLRPVEFSLLALVAESPGIGPAQLARALAMTKPHMTQCLGRLEERELVRRAASRVDGRVVEVHATAAGKRLATDSLARLREGEAKALATLSAAERAMLVELLAKVARCRRSGRAT